MSYFTDPLHDEFSTWILGFAPYGGGDVGEVAYLASQVTEADDDSFFEVFSGYAKQLIAEADAAAASGHDRTAHECYLRAAGYLGVAYHPLYGTPVDARLVDAFHLQMDSFAKAMALNDPPAREVRVPYEGTTIPAWFLRTPLAPDEVRPTILVGGGWDSTMVENHLGMGIAALRRGYHVVLHDGPGQGTLLIDEGLILRHDWEKVVTPVVDAVTELDLVDSDRIVYWPWSLGGYMAPRVAAYEHRLAAIIADPGQMGVGGKLIDGMKLMGLTDAQAAALPALDPDFEAGALKVIKSSRALEWSICKRDFWTNGSADFQEFVTEIMQWQLDPATVGQITCPTLVTSADDDRASTDSQLLFDALVCPKEHIHFTAKQGANMHCEMLNRSVANRKILDWLDDTLAAKR
jgi:alpha-beta hydrolase superfamily lysophospholipase